MAGITTAHAYVPARRLVAQQSIIMADDANDTNFSPNLSVESLLSVPLSFIFRETQTGDRGGGNGGAASGSHVASFIFSKSECATLIRVSMASIYNHARHISSSPRGYILLMLIAYSPVLMKIFYYVLS